MGPWVESPGFKKYRGVTKRFEIFEQLFNEDAFHMDVVPKN